MDYIELFNSEIYKGVSRRLRESFIKKNYIEFYLFIKENYHYDNFTESLYNFMNPKRKKCKGCNEYTTFKSFSKGYLTFCSRKCSSNNKEVRMLYNDTIKNKYGVDNISKSEEIKEKKKNKSISKYGVDHVLKSPIVRSKIEETMMRKYGVKNSFQSDEIKNKIKKRNLEKYGVDHNSKCKSVVEKRKETNVSRYGVESFSNTDTFSDLMKKWNRDRIFKNVNGYLKSDYTLVDIINGEYVITHLECGETFNIQPQLIRLRSNDSREICKKCNPFNKGYSKSEKEVVNFILEMGVNVIENHRINNKEIDIYIPELKLGIEYNGLYWHSELHKNKNYHLDKMEFFKKNDISIINVWEDDWRFKRDIICSILSNMVGKSNRVYARKCKIMEVDNKSVRSFLDENHIQGFVGSKVKLGLYYGEELVSLMTFGNLRKNLGQVSKEGSYELLRFCNKLNTTVVGGASKLFKYFLNNYNPEYILSYADRSRYSGGLYEKLGFDFVHNTSPSWFYNIDGLRVGRFNFRKDKLIKAGYDPNKTSRQIMLDRGYYRIYDCGVSKWEFNI